MKKSPEILSVEREILDSVLSQDEKRSLLAELARKTPEEMPLFKQKVTTATSEALSNVFDEHIEPSLDLPQAPTHAVRLNDVAIKLAAVESALNDAKKQYNQFIKATSTRIIELRVANLPLQLAAKKELDGLQKTRDTILKIYQGKREESLTSKQKEYLFARVENFKADVRAFSSKVVKQEDNYWKQMDRNVQLERAAQEVIHSVNQPSRSEGTLAAARSLVARFKTAVTGIKVNKSPSENIPPLSPDNTRPEKK